MNPTLFDPIPAAPPRTGPFLRGKMRKLYEVLSDGRWHDKKELCDLTDISALSITARVDDLRKESYGSHTVLKEKRGTIFVFRIPS